MSVTVIECKDKALLSGFKFGLQFGFVERGIEAKVEQGQNDKGTLNWLIIEDDNDQDNATYRLTKKGIRFARTGVEI